MATRNFLTSVDFNKNQILNVALQTLGSAPSGPVIGQFYYNTTDNLPYLFDGTNWLNLVTKIGDYNTLVTGTDTVNRSWTAADLTKWIKTNPGGFTTKVDLSLGTVTTTTQPINNSAGNGVTLPAATSTTAGLLTASDKAKLDGIAANATNFTLLQATDTTLGGIKLFDKTTQSTAANAVTNTASRTYGVQVNSNGQAVVNIPWTGTVYTHPTYTGGPYTTTGASVISQITVTNGHITGVTNRTLTTSDLSFMIDDTSSNSTTTTWSTKKISDTISSITGQAITGALVFKGSYNASSNTPNLSSDASIKTGYTYVVSTAGTFLGQDVEAGDMIVVNSDSPGSTASNYSIVNKNIPAIVNASTTASGIVQLAIPGTTPISNSTLAVTPAYLASRRVVYTLSGDNNTKTFSLSNPLGTSDVITQLQDSSGNVVEAAVNVKANTITIDFNIPVASGVTYRLIVL